ncbi:MAG: type III-A CRISPR-associated RAMP protein Csm5 [Promethearchaeota archaeon]
MENMKNVYNIEYELITPVHIGSGDKIPKTELAWFPQQRKLYKVDMEKFFAMQTTNKLSEISNLIVNARNEYLNDILNIRNFDEANLPEEYFLKFLYNYNDKEISKLRELNGLVKNISYNPFIPGSSIKGWLRTAILYYYLKRFREAKESLDSIDNKLDYIKPNKLKEERKEIGKTIEKKLLGVDPKQDLLKFLIISDTNEVPKENIHFALAQIFRPTQRGANISFEAMKFPLYLEVLKEKLSFQGKIIFNKNLSQFIDKFLKNQSDISLIIQKNVLNDLFSRDHESLFNHFRRINNIFASKIIQFEYNYFSTIDNNLTNRSANLERLLNFYNNTLKPLMREIKQSKDQFLIRIGRLTGWHSKTLGSLLFEYFLSGEEDTYDFEEFFKRLNRLRIFKEKRRDDLHVRYNLAPISRSFIVDGALIPKHPLGWIKCKLIK